MPLTTLKIKALAKKGRYGDANGLYLQVSNRGAKSWIYRYCINGRSHEMGLGGYDAGGEIGRSLAQARVAAHQARVQTSQGVDPLTQREAAVAAARGVDSHSFRDATEAFFTDKKAGWSNPKHARQWRKTVEDHAYPIIGDMQVSAIRTEHVLKVLQPIWTTKTETASRLRGRIESIMSYAKALGWRSGENAAAWKDNLKALLPSPDKVSTTKNHPAMPWAKVPAFIAELTQRDSIVATALRFLVLTATRTNETAGAMWSEIDMDNAMWTIPARRMKNRKEHKVPLSPAALAILAGLPRDDDFVFGDHKPIHETAMSVLLKRMVTDEDVTVHGFRSSFSTWAAETTTFQEFVIEMALAHTVSDKVIAAYRRSELIEKRRNLLHDWSAHCIKVETAMPVAA